jgi:GT2 family glycosyltransferase
MDSGAAFLRRRARQIGPRRAVFLYAEEVDLFTRLARGWAIVFTPELEVLHEQGVSTGRSRRMQLVHSDSVYRYFEKHHARGWRRALLPVARVALRARAELVSAWDRLRGAAR